MRNLYFKLLRNNLRDYVLVIMVGVVMVSMIYTTTAITAYLYQIVEGRPGTGTEVYGQLGVFIITYVLMIFLLILVILEYIRKRRSVYGVLNVLGISGKQRSRFIAAEYAGIVSGSLTGGLIVGSIVDMAARKVIVKFLLDGNSDALSKDGNLILLTFIISILVFMVLFLVSDQLIACLGLEAMLNPGKSRTLKLTNQKFTFMIAFLLEGLAIRSYFGYWGMVNKLFPIVLGSMGLYILIIFAGDKWAGKRWNSKRKYYKNLVWTCNWYEQLQYYLKQAYLLAVAIFVILVVLGISFLDHYPPVTEENYPYDIVWMADQKDISFIENLEKEYSCKIEMKECIRVTTPDFGEHMGISVSAYNQWANQELELENEEIFIIYQRERKQRNELGIDYGRKKPRIYMGNATYDLWIWETPKIMPSNKFDKEYKIAGEKDLILTGIYESSALKKMKSGMWENIIVFSDEYFGKIQADAQGANLGVMINVSAKQYETVVMKIKEYARKHSQKDFFSTEGTNLIYEKEKVMKESQSQNLIQVMSVGINGIILLFCGIFILVIKQKNDTKELYDRYLFYEKMGMEKRKRKKNIYKESYMFTSVAIISGGVIGSIFSIVEIFRKHMDIKWTFTYITCITGIYAGILVLFIIVTGILAYQDILKIEGRIHNG